MTRTCFGAVSLDEPQHLVQREPTCIWKVTHCCANSAAQGSCPAGSLDLPVLIKTIIACQPPAFPSCVPSQPPQNVSLTSVPVAGGSPVLEPLPVSPREQFCSVPGLCTGDLCRSLYTPLGGASDAGLEVSEMDIKPPLGTPTGRIVTIAHAPSPCCTHFCHRQVCDLHRAALPA